MSCKWYIKCLDCGEEHWFNETNHKDDWMRALIKNADKIADFAAVIGDVGGLELRLEYQYGVVETEWFVKHRGHQLSPVDEYGRLDNQCHEQIPCTDPACWHQYECALTLGHDGPHQRRCHQYHNNTTRCSLLLGHEGACR